MTQSKREKLSKTGTFIFQFKGTNAQTTIIFTLNTLLDRLSHLIVKTEITFQIWFQSQYQPFNSLEQFNILLPHASAGLYCRSRASQWHSCSTQSVMCWVWAHVCSFLTPSRVHLVCSFLFVCLFHFHAPDWFKLNCPSCSYRIHPQWFHTHTRAHTNTTNIQRACIRHSTAFQLSTATGTTLLFAKWLSNHLRVSELCLHVRLLYLQWGERAKATESICSNVRNLVLTQITGEERDGGGHVIAMRMSGYMWMS